MPGFAEGFANIARDEHRHVAYGTWFLQQKCAGDRFGRGQAAGSAGCAAFDQSIGRMSQSILRRA
jgi:hypothetical protein